MIHGAPAHALKCVRILARERTRGENKLMATNKRLNKFAVKVGTAAGKADRAAHKFAKAGGVAQEELKDIAKQVAALQAQLMKTHKRLKKALS
jgi:hypothetical protein